MPTRLVPERTIDSLLAVEVVRHDPHALIWSPTQVKDSWDHEILATGGWLWIFECKAVLETSWELVWRAPVDRDQLDTYVDRRIPAIYVFLAKPFDPNNPSVRPCSSSPCDGERCRMCCNDVRTLSDGVSHVASARPVQRLQPWFCHWAWAIRAERLQSLMATLGTSGRRPRQINTMDSFFISHAEEYEALRLCHLLSDIGSGGTTWTAGHSQELNFPLSGIPRARGANASPPVVVSSAGMRYTHEVGIHT